MKNLIELLRQLFCIHDFRNSEYKDESGEWQDIMECSKCYKLKKYRAEDSIDFKKGKFLVEDW